MKIVNSDRCDFCNDEIDSIQHLFWRCSIVHNFWMKFENNLKKKCEHLTNFKLNEEIILFGHAVNFRSDDVFDLIMLCGKFYVYKCKLEKVNPALDVFMKILLRRYQIEKYMSMIHMEANSFRNKWHMYLPLLEVQNV